MKKQLNDFRQKVKNNICTLLVKLYVEEHHEMPNWEEEEEIVLDEKQAGYSSAYINSEGWGLEENSINKYKVTLDNNLFFVYGAYDYPQEICWDEISTDDLVNIYETINKQFKN